MKHRQDSPLGEINGEIVTFPNREVARIVTYLAKKAEMTNTPEDWQAWKEAVNRYRSRDNAQNPQQARHP